MDESAIPSTSVYHGGDGITRTSTEDSGGIDIDVGPIPENFPKSMNHGTSYDAWIR